MSVIGGLNTMSRLFSSARGDAYMNTLSGARRPTDDELARQEKGDDAIQANLKDLFKEPWSPVDAEILSPVTGAESEALAAAETTAAAAEASGSPYDPTLDRPQRHVELNLESIEDPMIRAMFDPARTDAEGSMHAIDRFSPAQLDEMVRLMKPEYLMVLRQKNLAAGDVQAAAKLSFHNISYKHEGRQILTNCSGFVDSGELVGMCGGPDSGVSALLELLSGSIGSRELWHKQEKFSPAGPGSSHPRDALHASHLEKLHSYIDGYVLYDGKKPSRAFHSIVGFAPKSDVHLPYLTVYETLYFSARLRLPKCLSDANVRLRVLIMLKVLGLSHVKDTIVGDASIRGVSGGEKRRVGFGVELVAGHSILLADLPTNGLDSASALGLIQSMSYACAGGFSLLFSIVQASQEILNLMDRIILMSKGHIIYTGPPSRAQEFLASQGFRKPPQKALPQFLEELSANPEKFWMPFLTTRISDAELNAGHMQAAFDLEAQKKQQILNELKPGLDRASSAVHFQSPLSRTYDFRSPKTPRQQAFDCVYHAWLQTPAHEAMMQVLDTAHARPAKLGYRSEQRRIMRRISSVFYGKQTLMDRVGDSKQVEMVPIGQSAPPAVNGTTSSNKPVAAVSYPIVPSDNAREVSASKVLWHVGEGDDEDGESHAAAVMPYIDESPHSDGANGTNGTSPAKSASPSLPVGPPVQPAEDLSVTGNILQRHWYSKYQSSIWQQFASNMDRQIKATLRNTGLWRDVWLLAIAIGVIIGLLFYQLGQDENGVRQRVSLFFFLLTYVAFNAVQLVPVLAQQRPIFYVQSLHSDWYSSFTYFVPLMLVQLPIVCVEAFLLLLPVYGISDLTGTVVGGGRFWTAYLILLMNSYIARTFMLLLYIVSPNESIADVFNQVTGILFSKLCGFFIPAGSIVQGWKWVFYISWFTYALRAMSINDVASIVHACAPSPLVECRAQTGSQLLVLLYDMDLDVNNLWGNVWSDVESLLYFFLAFGFASAVLLAYVDWSEIDNPEAPDFGIANDQIADAQAWQEDEARNEKAALAEQSAIAAAADGKPRRSLSRRPSLSLVRRPSVPSTPINSPAASSGVQQLGAGSVASSPMASPRKAGGVLATLSRVLGHYTSGSRRRPVRSHIVLPVEDDDAGNEPEPLELGENAALAAALSKAGVADENARSEPSLEVLNQRSLTVPSSRSRAPVNVDFDAALNDGNSLTRTQQLHYQHEVHLLDIGKLLKAGRTPSTPAGAAQQQKRLTSKPSSAGSAAAVAAAKESATAGAIIEWSNLNYSVDVVDEDGKPYKRQLLSNCYGVCMPGTMVALMGASGAGKSTLLDVLANKKTGGYVTGSILLDGKPRDETFPHVTAYVEQWDSHSPYATVREALEFSARLRLAHDLNEEEIAARVDATLQILGIKHLEHEQLGGAEGVAGVSQEVRKKTTIGVELVSQPRLLFLDEPTTGLDAAGAFSVCQAIKNLSKHIAVMCTIHQPSQELIAMFDSLLLMQPGGKVSYCSSVEDIPRYFAAHELGVIAKDRNVSDFALESIRTVTQANAVLQGNAKDKGTEKKGEEKKDPKSGSKESSSPAATVTGGAAPDASGSNFAITVQEAEEKESLVSRTDPSVPKSFTGPGSNVPNAPPDNSKLVVGSGAAPAVVAGSAPSGPNTSRIRDLPAEFLASPEGQSITARLHKGIYASAHPEDTEAAKFAEAATKSAGVPTSVPPPAEPLRPFLTQLRCLFERDSFTILRNHRDLFIRFFLTLFMAFVVGTVFFRLDYTQVDAEERLSALFVCLLFIMFTANAFLPELFFARPMLFRERTSGSYAALPFFISRMLAQLPWILLENLPLAIMLVFISNLNQEHGNHPLALVYLCFVVVRYASLTATYFIGAMLGQPNNANTIQATYFNLLFVFTGFLIHYDSIPIGWKWFADINYLRWAFDFLAANEARNMAFTCSASDFILAEPSSFVGLCPADLVTTVGASPSLLPVGAVGYTNDTLLKCPYACGGDLLRQWGVDYSDGDMARNLGIVACFGMAFGIAAFLAIKFIQHIKR